jgi:hypothetical protein
VELEGEGIAFDLADLEEDEELSLRLEAGGVSGLNVPSMGPQCVLNGPSMFPGWALSGPPSVKHREYSHELVFFWPQAENSLTDWHPIGRTQRIFSCSAILLATGRE